MGQTGRFAYLTGSRGIYQYRVGADGELLPLAPAVVRTGGTNITIHPNSKSLYSTTVSIDLGTVFQLHITGAGTLQPLTPESVPVEVGAFEVSLTPDGKFAYVLNQVSSSISRFRVNSNGTLEYLDPPTKLPHGGIGELMIIRTTGSSHQNQSPDRKKSRG